MSELRWTLLILGVVFIAVLSWWERRRPRQAFAPRLRDANFAHGELSYGDAHRTASADPAVAGEPWIGEAGLSDVVSSDVTLPGSADARHPVGDGSILGSVQAPVEPPTPGPLEELPTLVIPDPEEQLALRTAWDEQPPEPTLIDPKAGAMTATAAPVESVKPTEPACAPEAMHSDAAARVDSRTAIETGSAEPED